MNRFLGLAAAATLTAMIIAPQAQAMQLQTAPARSSLVTLVRDGCGEGYFRNNGECREEREHRHGGIIGEIFGQRHDDRRDEGRVCPEGYHMGRHSGVCKLDE